MLFDNLSDNVLISSNRKKGRRLINCDFEIQILRDSSISAKVELTHKRVSLLSRSWTMIKRERKRRSLAKPIRNPFWQVQRKPIRNTEWTNDWGKPYEGWNASESKVSCAYLQMCARNFELRVWVYRVPSDFTLEKFQRFDACRRLKKGHVKDTSPPYRFRYHETSIDLKPIR